MKKADIIIKKTLFFQNFVQLLILIKKFNQISVICFFRFIENFQIVLNSQFCLQIKYNEITKHM